MDFIVGCNYWASNAGTEMWSQWDETAVCADLDILVEHNIQYLRVFPIWSAFQPVEPIYTVLGRLQEYRLTGERIPENPYYLDEEMVKRFRLFCDLCQQRGLKVIVGLIAGFMSGKLYIPAALYSRNLYSDPVALYFEQKYIAGLVQNLKDKPCIVGWDLGNECSGLSVVGDEFMADSWVAMIANAIRANDTTRPVVSGFNTLSVEPTARKWTIQGQAEHCDVLTTHPYAFFDRHTYVDRNASFRTALHGTCECKLYGDIGGKPCLVEEIGTLGPMVASEEQAAALMRVNLLSNWANGSMGVMWWCANEQTNLKTTPYTYQMCEVELGMLDRNRQPKPVLKETKRIAQVLADMPFHLPDAQTDAVCILTQGQDQWGVAYMTYCLSKQAGLNIRFCYSKDPLPEAKLYLMPSVSGYGIMPAERYQELKERVAGGASLYISNDDAIFSEFQALSGVHIRDSAQYADRATVAVDEWEIPFTRKVRYEIEPAGATVLATDSLQNPAITRYSYGRGTVCYVNFPLETMLLPQNDAFSGNHYRVYRKLFRNVVEEHKVYTDNPYVGLTIHPDSQNGYYCVAINYSETAQSPGFVLRNGAEIAQVYYGNISEIPAFEAVIFRIKTQE